MQIKKYELEGNIGTDMIIAVVADLHGCPDKSVINNLQCINPDIIAIVGDLIDGKRPFTNAMESFLKKCSEIANSYLSLGNHDFILTEADFEKIRNTGIMVLDNSWIEIKPQVFLGGFTSAYVLKCRQYGEESKKIVLSDLEWLNEFAKLSGYKILMDHHPENYQLYTRDLTIDLILSGHTHGGQISILGYGLYVPHQKLWPRYTGGFYDGKLVVSRGLSNSSWLPRIGNPTELVYVSFLYTLTSERKQP